MRTVAAKDDVISREAIWVFVDEDGFAIEEFHVAFARYFQIFGCNEVFVLTSDAVVFKKDARIENIEF